jgi:predicted TIM-barrel fold metal-dependent hydrolase
MWDACAFVGHWPFRNIGAENPEVLEQRLRREGFDRAYVSPYGLFVTDPQTINTVWGSRLMASSFFRFVPVLNPTVSGWERSLNVCREQLRAAAVRLHPNYHRYSCDSEQTHELAAAGAELGIPLIIQLRMQDVRTMNPLMQVPDTDWREAVALAHGFPEAPIVIAGANWQESHSIWEAREGLDCLYLAISHLERVDGLRRFLDRFGVDRLLLGSHAPLFTPTSARLKIETAQLSHSEREALCRVNAKALFRES